MRATAHEYFDLLISMRGDREGAEALSSLDIIDTKAGGIAGLIGGFSAASFFIIQLSLERHISSTLFHVLSLASVLFLSVAGLLCASSLFIISHFQNYLFADLDGASDKEKIETASAKILVVYQKRVRRYLWCLYSLYLGVGCLLSSVSVYLISTMSLG